MLQVLAGVLLAAAAVWFVLHPIFRPTAVAVAGDDDEGVDPADDPSPQAVALRALKEIEFDRATGKLSDEDYHALRARYTADALRALRAAEGAAPAARAPLRPVGPACPVCGVRPEADAGFCSSCGRRLGSGPGFCARCGGPLEAEARFCARCGSRVAA